MAQAWAWRSAARSSRPTADGYRQRPTSPTALSFGSRCRSRTRRHRTRFHWLPSGSNMTDGTHSLNVSFECGNWTCCITILRSAPDPQLDIRLVADAPPTFVHRWHRQVTAAKSQLRFTVRMCGQGEFKDGAVGH